MSLKIGEMARLSGMPVETIRFYEKSQILSPRRRENSTYREYEPWEIFDLFDCIGFRNRGFSVREVKKIMKEASIDEVCSMLDDKIDDLKWQHESLDMQIQELTAYKKMAETARLNVGQYWFEALRERICIPCTLSENGKYRDFDHMDARLTTWIKGVPFVKAGILVDHEELVRGCESFEWILMTDVRYLPRLDIDPSDGIKTISADICLCTIMDMGERGKADPEAFRQAIIYTRNKGFTCESSVLDSEKFSPSITP